MSHTVTIKTTITDLAAIQSACGRLRLPNPVQGEIRLFDRLAQGIGVQLDGWRFPVCIESDGNLLYDNFGGFWGLPEKLDQFQQAYAVEKAKLEARKQGYTCQESLLADGSIRLNVLVEA
jgi:hypothetical protein